MWLVNKLKNLTSIKKQKAETLEFDVYRYYSSGGFWRTYYDEETKITYYSGSTIGALFIKGQTEPFCYTLERPRSFNNKVNNKDNPLTELNESCCIPAGQYTAKYTYSPKFEKKTYLLLNVNNRDLIRIHSANHINDLLGCIALGNKIKKNQRSLNDCYDYYLDNSRKAIRRFEELCQGKDIKINFIDNMQSKSWEYIIEGCISY